LSPGELLLLLLLLLFLLQADIIMTLQPDKLQDMELVSDT
jgi:hypothetical protein